MLMVRHVDYDAITVYVLHICCKKFRINSLFLHEIYFIGLSHDDISKIVKNIKCLRICTFI
jgi:hypothetical protein